jgi:hypothetical protein
LGALASASGFTSGALGSLVSGIVTGGEAVTADTLIGTILLLCPDCDEAETNAL